MEKLLENMTEGKINDKEVFEIKYNGEKLWCLLDDKYVLKYTIEPNSDTEPLNKKNSSNSYYRYLVEIDDYGTESHNYYTDIEIKLKDGSITKNLSSKVKDIESIKIYFPSNTKKISFRGSNSYSHRIKELKYINTKNITNMSTMFYYCDQLVSLDLSNFDTSNVTNMSGMFSYCDQLVSLDLSNFDTSNVTSMNAMFNSCDQLASLDLSNWDTSNVKYMKQMFRYCISLTSLNLSSFDTSKVEDMYSMFFNCKSLTSLDLSNFNTSKVSGYEDMFFYVPSSCDIYIGDKFTLTTSDTNFKGTFIKK